MTRLPLSRAAATALALLALACERVETKSLLTDLDRLDDIEAADPDPDELAADTFDPEPDEIITDHDDAEADDDEESDALPPGCRDDAPVDGCPCTGTSFHAQWGDEICDPRQLTDGYPFYLETFDCLRGRWRFLQARADPVYCQQSRCIGYRFESKRETGGAILEGWPCTSNHYSGSTDSACINTPCVCSADGICIPRDEYEGDADTDVDLLEIMAELPEELPFDFRGRNSR